MKSNTIIQAIAVSVIQIMLCSAAYSEVVCPRQYPEIDLKNALHDPDRHAWNLFAQLNHPADLKDQRGIPDEQKKLGEPGRVVWETWKLARTEVFLTDGRDPGGWNTPSDPMIKIVDPPKIQALLGSVKPNGLKIQFDAGEVSNETRQNCATYKFIVENNLFNIEGQEATAKSYTLSGNKLSFPIDSIEVKASWRKFTMDDIKSGLDKKYYSYTDENSVVWGLATLHIVTKEIPNWFWASFRNKNGPEPKYPKQDKSGMPDSVRGTVWENYELSGSQIDFVESNGQSVILSDPIIEAGFERSSCMSCHANAGIRRIYNGRRDEMPFSYGLDEDHYLLTPLGAPEYRLFMENAGGGSSDQSVFQQDFVFSLRRASNKQ